ncbi:MAG: M13 family metallopeptidase [candidate division Zixibacteria bacterium]|nr:M13 family metallopeptidase [candidate division Zixibacteria bacterium]
MKTKLTMMIIFLLIASFSLNANELIGMNHNIIDTSINPGDDFYTYASGLWLKNEIRPDNYGRFGYYNQADKIIEEDIFNILNGNAQFDSTNHLADVITKFYQSAMDTVRINNGGLDMISTELVMVETIKTMADLQKVVTKLVLIGIDPFFDIYKPEPWQILDSNYACFTQSRLGLPNGSDYLTDISDPSSKISQYKSFVIDLLSTATGNKEEINTYADNVISIETDLSSKRMSQADLRNFDKTYNLYKIKKLKSLIPQFDWEIFLSELGMTNSNKVVIGQPKYFKNISKIFKKYDIESLKSYLRFVLLYRSSPYLQTEIADKFWRFKIETCGWQNISREIFIYDIVNREIPDALGALFIQKYFPKSKKEDISGLINDLKAAFRNRVIKNDWTSKSSKESILKKLDNMKFLIGGPEIDINYEDLNMNKNSFIQNLFFLREFTAKRHLSTMGMAKDNKAWSVNPHSTNAWYSPTRNLITLPAGNINEFWSNDDDAWNYGTLGATIAHEITHGFDATGRKFDENGNSIGFWKNVTGWFGSDNDHFEDCASLLEKKYNKFVVLDSFYVNGENTLNENLADLGGLNIAYDAYILSLDGHEPDTINGYNGYQRFFLSYAQKWRELFEEKTLIRSLSGYHAPPQYRTNGVVYNLPGFYEAFNIDKSAKMYLPPEDRIIIW